MAPPESGENIKGMVFLLESICSRKGEDVKVPNVPFKIDVHVHSAQYSACAETLLPQKIGEYAKKAGLDGVVLTEHDSLWDPEAFLELRAKVKEIEIYNGIEVTDDLGHHYVVIGISEMGPLRRGINSYEILQFVHRCKGVVILAHPFRNGLPPLKIIEKVDAIEIGSTSLNERESQLAVCLANSLNKPTIACSDAHSLVRIGWGFTILPQKPGNEAMLCSMIRDGLGKPVLPFPFIKTCCYA